jgi:retron-type reverse transcriptase
MRDFDAYFNENEILRQLCKIRVKIAKNRNRRHLLHLLTSNKDYNYHIDTGKTNPNEFESYQNELKETLKQILPPRRKWIKIGEHSRVKNRETNEFLTSNDKNFYSLLKTIKKHKKTSSTETWFLNLQEFVKEIQESALSNQYSVSKPIIFPKLKKPLKRIFNDEEEKNNCRPLSMYSLKDRIILSLTNKFLTSLFDKKFRDSSYAFRSKKIDGKIVSHHNCIQDIIKYKKASSSEELFVVECDMKSFYDTVNHNIVLETFENLIEEVKKENPLINLSQPIHIFKSFLDSYAFNVNVKKLDTKSYWASYSIKRGNFPWVDNDINKHYKCIKEERIGVPQGGALSGLIANIYLNNVDQKLEELDVFYIRFCDDMIIIGEDFDKCYEARKVYVDSLNELKLFPHPFKKPEDLFNQDETGLSYKPFWKGKSKGPYKWSNSIKPNYYPWIAFVGYEIKFNCNIRVRKRSFLKEQTKQRIITNEITKAIEQNQRCEKGTAIESAINRLIGMSVGRIGLDNFSEVSTDMCWKNGFQELELNKFSKIQIKQLDRNRSKLYYDLFKKIKKLERDDDETVPRDEENRQYKKYDKPFSYYYQILERKENGSS